MTPLGDRIDELEAMLHLIWERIFWVDTSRQPTFEVWLADLQTAVRLEEELK